MKHSDRYWSRRGWRRGQQVVNYDLWLNSPWWPKGSAWWRLRRRRRAVTPVNNESAIRRFARRKGMLERCTGESIAPVEDWLILTMCGGCVDCPLAALGGCGGCTSEGVWFGACPARTRFVRALAARARALECPSACPKMASDSGLKATLPSPGCPDSG